MLQSCPTHSRVEAWGSKASQCCIFKLKASYVPWNKLSLILSQTVVQCPLSPGVTRDQSPWLRAVPVPQGEDPFLPWVLLLLESPGLWEVEQVLDNTLSISLMRDVQQMARAGLMSLPWAGSLPRCQLHPLGTARAQQWLEGTSSQNKDILQLFPPNVFV